MSVLYDQKRLKLLRRARLFNWAPFTRKVYIAGSVALGNVHENSDFDVIVVTEPGRLYTCRFFCLLLFGLMGWRRTLRNSKDGFCFNTFVTLNPETFKLETLKLETFKPVVDSYPSDRCDSNNTRFQVYEKKLYQSLVEIPICPIRLIGPISLIANFLEPTLKRWQISRIKKFLKKFPPHSDSRVVCDDERVELCLNLKKC